jgi:gliding motility-associated lipoprotein GldH
MKTILFSILFFSIAYTSCVPSNVFEKNVAIPNCKWKNEFKPTYEFEITDTVSNYSLFLTMRHTDAYQYANIWLNIKTKMPNENEYTLMRIEVPLAQENGKWLARKSMNEIYEHKASLTGSGAVHFAKKGIYTIQLEQIMRVNPLTEVMSVGIRLEKIVQ